MALWRGTLHVVIGGRDRIVACFDSRNCSDDGTVSDDARKLFKAGRYSLCGISGVLSIDSDLSVSTAVEGLCSEMNLQDSPRRLIQAISHDLYDPIRSAFEGYPLPEGMESIFEAFVIRRKPTREVDLSSLAFPITNTGSLLELTDPILKSPIEGQIPRGSFVYPSGHTDCLRGFPLTDLNADVPDDKIIKDAEHIFSVAKNFSKTCGDEISGPIDIAAIDSSGFNWLQRKPIRP